MDDIEIVYKNGACKWIQAKERVAAGSTAWVDLWANLHKKRAAIELSRGDRLALWIGLPTIAQQDLADASRRAHGARSAQEWWTDLSIAQQRTIEGISPAPKRTPQPHQATFELLRCTEFQFASIDQLRRDFAPLWLPRARGITQEVFFDVLVARALAGAAFRRVFTAGEVLNELRAEGINLSGNAPGAEAYVAAVARDHQWMKLPGTTLAGETSKVFVPPRLREASSETRPQPIDDEYIEEVGRLVPADSLPLSGEKTVIIGGAGSGKTALITWLLHRAGASARVPALVRLVELMASRLFVAEYLQQRISARYSVDVDWVPLCESGSTLILFDGLDELNQDQRSLALDTIAAYSARFPAAPWIMTVRDMVGTAAPAGARLLELQPLRQEDIEPFCRAWLPPERQHLAAPVNAAISISRELRRMARVPFLLALMVDHAFLEGGPAPTRRTALIEDYLRALLRPGTHKPSAIDEDRVTLRDAASKLALLSVGDRTIGFTSAAASVALGTGTQSILDALVACGLLRESRDHHSFTFPLVQEYLAGDRIAALDEGTIVARFEESAARPWRQSLQFALELSPNADSIIAQLLSSGDDAFGTKLKLIGRCIANGAPVSDSTRLHVGDLLTVAWLAEGR